MHHFAYKDGEMAAEDVPLARIAEAVGTPFYCYSTATLERHYRVFSAPFEGLDALICFAVKANSNVAVIRTLARLGAGADVVSGGELDRALAAGIPPERIVFSGIGKTADEMAAGLRAGIHQFNVESEPELRLLNDVALGLKTRAPVTLRVNPDVDSGSHAKITTGRSDNKFGIPWSRAHETYNEAGRLPGIDVVGVDVHIGSQLTDLEPFEAAFHRVVELIEALRADGHAIDRLDLGGGLGIPYEPGTPPPHPDDYGAMVRRIAGESGCSLILEPGRLIAGNAGILVSRVLYVKEGESRSFVILDAAMNDLLRPAMYEAYHGIQPVREPARDTPTMVADFVGPVCESADTFARDREIAEVEAGDLVVIHSAGAYGAVMASTYNARPLVPEVLVKADRFSVIRPRIGTGDLMALDRVPDWLENEDESRAAE